MNDADTHTFGTGKIASVADTPSVMLVDDEAAFADALAFRLQTWGIPVQAVYRGEAALAFLKSPALEVILLDINMPGLDGLDVLREIKARRPDVEVVLLTGESDIVIAAKGMRRGAGDYLLKPVDFDALLASLEKAQQRARAYRERLRAAEAGRLMVLGTLAAGVGHEINNPLQIIIQRSEWLQELIDEAAQRPPDLEEMAKTAEVISRQASRAGAITAQLLDLAHRSREGRAETNLPELVRKVAAAQAERTMALRVYVTLELDENLPPLLCSSAELEPILYHLLRNALDAIEASKNADSGDEKTAPARIAAACIRIVAGIDGNVVRVVVEDTGEGIAPEHAPHIFDPFFSTRPVGKGTGLGLTVCHSIVTTLRGKLEHTPAKPRGTVFTVEIPMEQDEERSLVLKQFAPDSK